MIIERSVGRRPSLQPSPSRRRTSPRLLIVDDSAFARAQLRGLLAAAGAEIVGEAESAEQGVTLFSVLRPDIVTMDINMPGLSGVDAVLALRELDERCRIVLITALQRDPIVAGLAAMGIPVLRKPVDEDELRRQIQGLRK